MVASWRQYQEDAAACFRGLGLSAETDVRLTGARGQHDVDVVVRSKLAGVDLLWVVECKQWKRPVTKAPVLALIEIVRDLGADRGFLLSESGFQTGARRCAKEVNVTLGSINDLPRWAEHDEAERIAPTLLVELPGTLSAAHYHLLPCSWRPFQLPEDFGGVLPEMRARVAAAAAGLRAAIQGEFPVTVPLGGRPNWFEAESLPEAVARSLEILRDEKQRSRELFNLVVDTYPPPPGW